MLGICFCTNAHIMEDINITSCSRLLTNIGQGQQCVKNVKRCSQAPEDVNGLYLVFWWANFTTTTATFTHNTCMNTAKLIQKCVSVFFRILPRCPAVDPHTADPQRPLEQHKVGCRTMWPEASRAERNSQIQNLHRRNKRKNKVMLWG